MKKTSLRRACAAVLCLWVLSPFLLVQATALTPSYRVSNAYQNSTYHKNLKALPMTGDGAFDTLSVALSQYGYHEGAGTAELHGQNGTSAGNFTEYGYAFGKVSGTYSYAWCAVFAWWCLSQAGEGDSAGGAFSSCSLWIARLRELGQYTARSAHTPRMGDLIFFRSAGVSRASDHVGLVLDVRGGRVYTVEGNSSDRVSLRSYALTDTYIVGYGRPDYENEGQALSRTAHEDRSAGYYVVTYDFLNVRAARSSSAAKKGALDKGELVRVSEVKNGWGRIDYNGGVAYISLEYADFVTPSAHKISYASEGKTLYVHEFLSTEAVQVKSFTPERAGYEFLGWRDADGTEYKTAQALLAEDLTLTAAWREIPPAVQEEDVPPEDTETLLPAPELAPDGGSGGVLTPQTRDYTLAEVIAGVIVFLVAGLWIGVWVWLQKKRA